MAGRAPPDAATGARSGCPAVGRRSRGCPDAGYADRRPVRVLCPLCGRPCPIGQADVRCPRARCPRDRCHAGVRTDGSPVSAALQPRCPDRAGPWNGSVRRAVPVGAMGSTCRRGLRAAWSPARMGLKRGMVLGWPWVARTRVDGGSGPPHRTRTGCGGASPPGRQGSWSSARVLVGWLGSTRTSGCSPVPRRGILGRLSAWCPTMGLDRQVVTTLCGRCGLVMVLCRQSGGPIRFGQRADCGRAAAAAREECCRPGTDRALTSQNGGGRDRV
jgi:hypothetical protein